jgi:hypothetical protein
MADSHAPSEGVNRRLDVHLTVLSRRIVMDSLAFATGGAIAALTIIAYSFLFAV